MSHRTHPAVATTQLPARSPILSLPTSMLMQQEAHRLADAVIGGTPDVAYLADLSLRLAAWADEMQELEAEARSARR